MSARWIELDGAENVRDVGGLPTVDGRAVAPGRLIRSDSLQELTEADVRRLVDELRVRAVVDLRTGVEVDSEGPGPMTKEPLVEVRHLSLFPEAGRATDAAVVDAQDDPDAKDDAPDDPPDDQDAPVVLPWQTRESTLSDAERRQGAAAIYLRYLVERADSILGALRLIADSAGSTIVHCAAGKDRTGVVIAFALAEVGVTREAIVEDYARSAERIEAIFARLSARRTYRADLSETEVDHHRPRAVTMERLLEAMDEVHGGIPAWLRANGWTEDDAARLRAKLLD